LMDEIRQSKIEEQVMSRRVDPTLATILSLSRPSIGSIGIPKRMMSRAALGARDDVVETAFAVSRESAQVIVGDPPCQDFSVAGLRTEAAYADLTVAFAEVVRACRPLWFLMENVPAAASSRAWAIARRRLRAAGYGLPRSCWMHHSTGRPSF